MQSLTWTFGSDPSCDVWIRAAEVAPIHCRLTHHQAGYQVEDFSSATGGSALGGSAMGTTVNGVPVSQPTACSPADCIRLAGVVELPWPDPNLAQVAVGLGYAADNEYPIAHDDSISGRHAMLMIDPADQILLTDCDSTNGTWVDNQRIKSTLLAANESFRVGITELTPQTVFSNAGYRHFVAPSTNEPEIQASPTDPSDWWYAGVLAATLLIAGVVAMVIYSGATTPSVASIF